ncbi:glycoside hydrolase family 2 TIM barrel-domain containing protein [Glaciihabitans sp. UYNi722]|uniref:glycoside hydrolase family 2 TIM barrel-domain containing protein n=1 Tax=Glaciihabitans sp. UYNi722 TaxID=3156344 RepID=UPI003396E820
MSGGVRPEYLSDRRPGYGAEPARSWLHSTSAHLDLSGQWAFRLLPHDAIGSAGPHAFASLDLDDSTWERIAVPSSWVLDNEARFGRPIYTNVQFPFPIDPPAVPDDNPTGEYRREVELEDSVISGGRLIIRFDGVESAYRVWWNGTPVGIGKGSRLAHEFDVTKLARPGRNVLAVRVHQWSDASYLEDQDQWWLPGIFRDVTLLKLSDDGIDDVWLRTSWRDGQGVIDPELRAPDSAFPVRLSIEEIDIDVLWRSPEDVLPLAIGDIAPWSAESPRLYNARVASRGEIVSMRLGFRTVEIRGDQLLVNGQRLVIHGMNRHEAHPDRGRVFNEEHARADLARMKRFNVNAIRTSHYPPHPRLLDLADELGFWVMLECDLETHGFEPAGVPGGERRQEFDRLSRLVDRDGAHAAPGHSAWAGNPSDDPEWRDAYLDRIRRTVERDKNHPSVVIWSLGNESGTGANLAAMAAWVHDRDPDRPLHYEGDYAGAYTDIYSRMYATIPEVVSIGSDAASLLLGCSSAESYRQRTKPFLQCEYAHAMGNGPGALDQYEEITDRFPRVHGGFVWEWRDHGISAVTSDGHEYFAYGGDFGEVIHDSNFVMDGMVLSNDVATPGLHEFAAVAAPFRIESYSSSVRITNRRHDLSSDDVEFIWRVLEDGNEGATGVFSVPPIAAGDSVLLAIPQAPDNSVPHTERVLDIEARMRQKTAWAVAGHVVSRGQIPLGAPVRPRHPVWQGVGSSVGQSLSLGPARFEDGELARIADMPVEGPFLCLFRAPTDNDEGTSAGGYANVDPWTQPVGVSESAVADTWRRAGLNRLTSRLLNREVGAVGVRELRRWSAAGRRESVVVETRWQQAENGVLLTADIQPSAGWDMVWPRMGLVFGLPSGLVEASWFGMGPGEAYPDSMRAARLGQWKAPIDELVTDYAMPQESGHRPGLRQLELSGEAGRLNAATIADSQGRLPGFTVRRHSPTEVALAKHPFELSAPNRTWLHIDVAQHGLGSRACGPDVWPSFALRPHAATLRLIFS